MHARVSAFTETRVCARRCVCMPTGTLHMSQQATRTTSGSDMRDHRSSGAPQCGSVRCARFGAYLPAGIALVGGCRGRVLAPAGGAGACARCGMRTRRSGGACAGLYIRMPTAVWSAERAAVDRCGVCAPTDEHPPQANAPHARRTVQRGPIRSWFVPHLHAVEPSRTVRLQGSLIKERKAEPAVHIS